MKQPGNELLVKNVSGVEAGGGAGEQGRQLQRGGGGCTEAVSAGDCTAQRC